MELILSELEKCLEMILEIIRQKLKAIQNTEIFMDKYAIAICPSEGTSMPTVVWSTGSE